MRRYAIAVTAVLVAVAGCSSGGDGEPAAAKTTVKAAVKLSTKWTPKIKAAQGKGVEGVCADPGSAGCADYLTDLVLVVYDLRDVMDEQRLKGRYPRVAKRIAKIDRASVAYSEHECKGDPNAGATARRARSTWRTSWSGRAR